MKKLIIADVIGKTREEAQKAVDVSGFMAQFYTYADELTTDIKFNRVRILLVDDLVNKVDFG